MQKVYDIHSNRLIFIREVANSTFWDDHWNMADFRQVVTSVSKHNIIIKMTQKYLSPTNGRILEGGCGMGQYVFALSNSGFKCTGVDWAKKTVKRVNDLIPEIDVRHGDVRDLDFDDNCFAGYWSMGVIEHFFDGYVDILMEAKRILKKSGILFITFPYMSPIRILKSRLNMYPLMKKDTLRSPSFYQFALNYREVLSHAQQIGFRLICKRPISGIKGFKDEVALFNSVMQKISDYRGRPFFFKVIRSLLDTCLSHVGAGHMMLLVLELEE